MARNQEKAQSMLFRFRESKMIELGMVNRGDRRPKVASMCSDLRQCERWRGELLKDVSRKVAKIQDQNLTEYEIRDLNDEINRLLREKYHWESQIINLGGANYRRAAPKMVTENGVEIPGMKGYKYFGRAKELPGVKQLFKAQEEEALEHHRLKNQVASIFSNQTPAYYGNLGDEDAKLLEYEKQTELENWQEQWANLCETLDLSEDTPAPPCPHAHYISLAPPSAQLQIENDAEGESADEAPSIGGKRKANNDGDEQVEKRSKNVAGQSNSNRILTVLSAEDLRGPDIPTLEQVEAAILARQKQDLLNEYVG